MSLFLSIAVITITWGIGNVLVKKGLQNLTPWQSYMIDSFLIAFPMWMIYGWSKGGSLLNVTPLAAFTVIFNAITFAIYYYAISKGNISLTEAIIVTYPLITLIFALTLLHERLDLVTFIGVLLTIIGVLVISFPVNFSLKLEKWVLPSVITAVGYGIGGYLSKLTLYSVDNASYLMMLAISQIIVVSLWRFFVHDPLPKIRTKGFVYSFIGIAILNIGIIAYYYALEKGFSSIVIPLSNTYIVLILILSTLWLKEKIRLYQIIGILSVVVGVILVGINIR